MRLLDERALGADYRRLHAATVRRHPRGYGLWTWKPYVIAQVLGDVSPGELILYCDAGCTLNAEGSRRLEEYLSLAADHASGGLAFGLDGTVGEWTKRQTLAACGHDTAEARGRPMVSATCLVLRAGRPAWDLVAAWWERMGDLRLVDDSPSPGGEHPEFRAHRHDQSIFTLLAHDRNLQTIPDETWWPGQWGSRRHFPLHARRWKQRLRWSQWWMRHIAWPRW